MKNTEELIRIDPEYRNGIGNRIVGVMNYEAPYIPLIMSWPDKQKAVGIIRECLDKDPHDRGNNYYFAEALIESGKSDEAIPYLEKVLALQPKEDFLMEDIQIEIFVEPPSTTNIIVGGSFEAPVATAWNGGTPPGWSVTDGNVDWGSYRVPGHCQSDCAYEGIAA